MAVPAVLAGAKSLAAIGEWAGDAPGSVRGRRDPAAPGLAATRRATVRRVLARVDPEALDQVTAGG